MEKILVLTHADETGSALTKASLEAVTAGLELAARLTAPLTIGIRGADSASRNCGQCVLPPARACWPSPARPLRRRATPPTPRPAKLFAAPRRPPSCSLPAVRALRALPPAWRIGWAASSTRTSQLSAATTAVEATRWFYRQRIEAVLSRDARPWFLLLDAGTHAALQARRPPRRWRRSRSSCLRCAPRSAACARRRRMRRPSAPTRELLFVAGAGWTKKQPDGQIHAAEAGELILGFLRATGASLGSSKSLVDQGGEGEPVLPFLTHMNQIGQTGSTPRHAKGLSTCCHGEEPHVVGWRFIGERRAICLDPNCGWTRGKADVVYVADAFQVMAKVNALLQARSA